MKRFCRKGIPLKYRSTVWMKLSKADENMKNNPSAYKTAASCDPPSNLLNVILAGMSH